ENAQYSNQSSSGKGPLVDRYSEDSEDRHAKCDIDGNEQEFHDYPPALVRLFSSSVMRRRRSSISFVFGGGSALAPEKPQPRSGWYAIAQIQSNGHSTCRVNRLTQPAAWMASSCG